jgi:AmmeMemoRadiSam system protein A
MTSAADRRVLLKIARDAIAAHVSGVAAPGVAQEGVLSTCVGAFVTLHIRGELRGCIGRVHADRALSRVVPECAVAACSRDPRFPPVTAAEVLRLEIELSILGAFEPVRSLGEVEIGRHGLLVERGWQRGLLLPQVATTWKWDPRMFVEQTCHKAGLPQNAWEHGAALSKFEAEVFSERSRW